MNQATPTISVIIPVFNSMPYLSKAIDSILLQTYSDFELIIINDGSTDNSAGIISTYNDNRIRYYENEENKGLVYTLNKGIELSRGAYIARMDGDDIALPKRFEKQLNYLLKNPQIQIAATLVQLINENDEPIGFWKEDKQAIHYKEIRKRLPKDNCIAHPSIICRHSLLKKYKYNSKQAQAEDYDLWLRLQADNVFIYKTDEILLQHRIVKNSFTRVRQQNVFTKNARTKWTFVYQQLQRGSINLFIIKTCYFAFTDIIKSGLKRIKKTIQRSNVEKLAI